MIDQIHNNILDIQINSRGAELFSIFRKDYNHEYLWQGDNNVWASRAPILFPAVGMFYDGYLVNGKKYNFTKHGIIRPLEFNSQKISDNRISLSLTSSETTKTLYPFDFQFTTVYSLEDNTLNILHIIENISKSEVLYFSFGLHTGFRIATQIKEIIEDSYIEFEVNEPLISSQSLTSEGYLVENYRDFGKGIFYLTEDCFDNDGIFFKNLRSKSVSLKSSKTLRYINMSWDNRMNILGLWAKPRAKFVCIEPCFGQSDKLGTPCEELSKKYGMIELAPQQKYYTNCLISTY
ncbi:MAG: hypothetical protein ACRC0X_08095 [Brevinema sp.]